MGIQPNHARALLSVVAVLGLTGPAVAQDTPISELVIYGLDGDFGMAGEGGAPGRLFHFHPGAGTYQVIGDTYLAGTAVKLWDFESLAYIPDGPNKGAYSVPLDQQAGSPKQKLIQISLFDATCTVVGSADLGNPLNGAAEPLTSIEGNPITVPWTDIEGIMFLTETQDPGAFVFDGCD